MLWQEGTSGEASTAEADNPTEEDLALTLGVAVAAGQSGCRDYAVHVQLTPPACTTAVAVAWPMS